MFEERRLIVLANVKKKISASEINKFCYCNYQWYYEKIYGSAEIRRLNYEYCEKNGFKGGTNKNFKKGMKFHNSYVFKYKVKRFFKFILFLFIFVLLAAAVYFINYYKIFDLDGFL